MKYIVILLVCLSIKFNSKASEDSLFIRKIYTEALVKGESYETLRSLCKDIGARITGSAEAEMAIGWGKQVLDSYGFDKVYLQEIMVPHWERGTTEAAWIVNEKGEVIKLDVLALGGSVGTDGLMQGEVVEVEHLNDLKSRSKKRD